MIMKSPNDAACVYRFIVIVRKLGLPPISRTAIDNLCREALNIQWTDIMSSVLFPLPFSNEHHEDDDSYGPDYE
jgi:hypothetical protein